jgi:hypothetical protein
MMRFGVFLGLLLAVVVMLPNHYSPLLKLIFISAAIFVFTVFFKKKPN